MSSGVFLAYVLSIVSPSTSLYSHSDAYYTQYLGPSVLQLTLLFVEGVVNTIVLIGMSILTIRMLWSLGSNTTTIEGWEIERHQALLRRARYTGGHLEGPNGQKVRITKQEFPWDIGIYSNISQGMGSKNPLVWIWPLAATLPIDGGLQFPENGLEDPTTSWPPPDPDRMFRIVRPPTDYSEPFTLPMDVRSFQQRQQADQMRYQSPDTVPTIHKRKPFHARLEKELASKRKGLNEKYDHDEYAVEDETDDDGEDGSDATMEPEQTVDADDGEEGWRNSEGERLADFGVDEDAEFYDEDDLPLAELMRRRGLGQAA